MKHLLAFSCVVFAACNSAGGVSGSLEATGGIDRCHDEDGDPVYFLVEAYELGVYDGWPGTEGVGPVDNVHVECADPSFELDLPEGTYDVTMIAFQEILTLGDFEDEVIERDVVVADGAFTELGHFTLDVNDDDE